MIDFLLQATEDLAQTGVLESCQAWGGNTTAAATNGDGLTPTCQPWPGLTKKEVTQSLPLPCRHICSTQTIHVSDISMSIDL